MQHQSQNMMLPLYKSSKKFPTLQYGKQHQVCDSLGELVLLSSDCWFFTRSMGKITTIQIPTKSKKCNIILDTSKCIRLLRSAVWETKLSVWKVRKTGAPLFWLLAFYREHAQCAKQWLHKSLPNLQKCHIKIEH